LGSWDLQFSPGQILLCVSKLTVRRLHDHWERQIELRQTFERAQPFSIRNISQSLKK
jgi:hypothetical protein